MIDVIFKIVSKAYAVRLDPIAKRIISPNQATFIKGRNIFDGSLALIEIIHELQVKRLGGILLKLDFEKAYDRVNSDFLSEVLRHKGFEEGYISQLVAGGQTAISINGEVGPFFMNKRGMLQGDELGVRFHRSLYNEGLLQWRGLQALVNNVELDHGPDSVRWRLSPDGSYSVKSMYSLLAQESYKGNILGTKSTPRILFSTKLPEDRGERKWGHEADTRAARPGPWPHGPSVWSPRDPSDSALPST
ncbi:hypothetical protein QYE76_023877 [Lolium multiflorum]|uniref:Reverse transcriptase domain-containing protein n=1 Tax=Lolium multiflorum TaxID=4521 RepID=A0AAD8RBD9_LOLMU|nr:hypothetical protein QYE76_023877 [Lolium multiflorum]